MEFGRPSVGGIEARWVQRFARDRWVRLHGTPRVTMLVGGDRERELYLAWAALVAPGAAHVLASGDLDGDVRAGCEFASRAPTELVAVATTRAAVAAWRAGRSDRLAAMVDEGLESGGDATAEGTARDAPPITLHARSAAEAALYAALEATPATAGRFQLNASLAVRFGPSSAEVDLLARADGVAIEIDGFHHFGDRDRYRRDRRKDVLLQAQGFFVVRVLAEDVVADPRGALALVLQALAARAGRAP